MATLNDQSADKLGKNSLELKSNNATPVPAEVEKTNSAEL
jgi:hypothetical protein